MKKRTAMLEELCNKMEERKQMECGSVYDPSPCIRNFIKPKKTKRERLLETIRSLDGIDVFDIMLAVLLSLVALICWGTCWYVVPVLWAEDVFNGICALVLGPLSGAVGMYVAYATCRMNLRLNGWDV